MNETQSVSPTIRRLIWQRVSVSASYGGTLAAGLLAAGGFFVDLFNLTVRIVLFVVAVVLAVAGVMGIRWRAKREQTESDQLHAANAEATRLRIQVKTSAPKIVLEVVGAALFVKPGGWRLTLFVIEQLPDKSWCLKPLITCASSEVFETPPHDSVLLARSRLREVLDVDANDPLRPFSNESANLPDRHVEPNEWQRLRSYLIPGDSDEFCMPTRKFAWAVTKEPASHRTLVLLGESVLPDGIQADEMHSPLLASTIALIARMYGVAAIQPDSDNQIL